MTTVRTFPRRTRRGLGELVAIDEPLPPRRPTRAVLTVDLDGVDGRFTFHAVERFRLRVCPHLTLEQATVALKAALRRHTIQPGRPAWLRETRSVLHRAGTHSYLLVDDRLCFPLVEGGAGRGGLVAVTCIVREDPAPQAAAA
jgi:hypothetical protein